MLIRKQMQVTWHQWALVHRTCIQFYQNYSGNDEVNMVGLELNLSFAGQHGWIETRLRSLRYPT